MKGLDFGRVALTMGVAAVFLTGCGGSQPPIGVPGAMPQTPAVATDAARNGSWIRSEAKSENLLYVGNVATVTVYSYETGKLVGSLTGFDRAEGLCVDKASNIFVTNYNSGQIFEYAHTGDRRIATIKSASPEPSGCSIDPTTGDLAVASLSGTVAIYEPPRWTRAVYRHPKFSRFFYCTYDPAGNLFADGQDGTRAFELAELPRNGNHLQSISLNQQMTWPGGVQWNDGHLTIGDQQAQKSTIYSFDIKGRRAVKVGSLPLKSDAQNVYQYLIDSGSLIAPNEYGTRRKPNTSDVLFYKWPTGGNAIGELDKGQQFPRAVALSAAR